MKKRIASCILIICVAFTMFSVSPIAVGATEGVIWDGTVATDFESGSGTEADPYVIKTPQQLAYLAEQVNSGTTYSKKYLVLADDIVLNDTTGWERWNVIAPANTWTAIGSTFAFKGNFDGKGYTISGIYINKEFENQGLFGYVRGGAIQNLGVTASYIHGENAVGGIVGYNENITISNCYNTGTVSGRGQVGGVAGYNYYDGIVENCYNTGTVKALTSGGGVVGCNKSTISNCYNTGSVSSSGVFDNRGGITASGYAGGIAGYNADATVISCYNTGAVSNIYDAGGIVGNNDNSTVSSCYNTGTIKGMRVEDNYGDKVGGIIGNNVSGIVSDCYNTGKISGGYWIGGVIGINNGKLSCCYNIGAVSGTKEVGGGVGRLKANGKVSSCYYLTDSAEFGVGSYFEGSEGDFEELTDEEMKVQASFVGFDFQDIWVMKPLSGYNYPQLTMSSDKSEEEDSVIWNGLSASGFESGSGTMANPYVIKTPNQLAYLSERSNNGLTYSGKYFVLANDIVLNDTTNWESWGTTAPENTWTAIGSGSGFGGNFDGKGYTISGVYINNDSYYQGLFGYAYNGTIQNLGVTASYIQGTSCVGGIVGRNSSTVTNCYNTGKVKGSTNVGGVVGYTYNPISNCYNTGEISSSGDSGGIVGCNDGTVNNCYNTGKVRGSGYSGGIAGWNYSATISNCYNTGAVSGGYVGGITGFNNLGSTVSSCYNTGGFSGTKRIRPVVGENDGTLKNCYYRGSYSYPESEGIGLTDKEMKQQASFAGFDFSSIWTIDNTTNNGYPYLQALPIFTMLRKDYVTLNTATNTASFAFDIIHSGSPTGAFIVTLRDKDNRLIGLKIIDITTPTNYVDGDDLTYSGVPHTYKAFFWSNLNDLTPLCESVGEIF